MVLAACSNGGPAGGAQDVRDPVQRDVNADGFIDLVVGAPGTGPAGDQAGRVFVFFGGPGGVLDTAQAPNIEDADVADVVLTGVVPNPFTNPEVTPDRFGHTVVTADVNGDQIADIIVGAPSGGGSDRGRVYVFFGGALLASESVAGADVTLTGAAPADAFGWSIATGDVNADGVRDIIAGAPGFDSLAGIFGPAPGRVHVFFGGALASGDAAGADATFSAGDNDFVGGLGISVAAGDVNGDLVGDVVAGAPFGEVDEVCFGYVFVFLGNAAVGDRTTDVADAKYTYDSFFCTEFGRSVATGDVTGDQIADVLIGTPGDATVFVFAGSANPFDANIINADIEILGEAQNDRFGDAVAAGDIDGNGIDDLLAGAPQHDLDAQTFDAGRAYVFFGGALPRNGQAGNADLLFTGQSGGDRLGTTIAAGDVSTDGAVDLLFGAPENDVRGGSSGRAYVFFGDPALISENVSGADVLLTGEVAGRELGHGIAGAR